jgi:site-specific recombinase XerD
MPVHNPKNERIKREYFAFLKEAKRQSEQTVDSAAKALDRFENSTNHKNFEKFHVQQAIAFKRHLAEQYNCRSGNKLSKATLHSTLTQIKHFFQWLAMQPGFKTNLRYTDAEFFNLSDKDTRVATARREQRAPTLEQVKKVINSMPASTEIELRNRALVAFAIQSGTRDRAIASMKLKHLDLATGSVYQDARDVHTKFSKTFRTFFVPVGEEVRQIFAEWVVFLRETKLWGDEDPLFPSTEVAVGIAGEFEATGLKRSHWRDASPIRAIFRQAFKGASLPYFNPHSFRATLVQFGMQKCQTPEEFKAYSQNLGHESPLTTFVSYGEVPCQRQGEIIRSLGQARGPLAPGIDEFANAVARKLIESGVTRTGRAHASEG